MNDTLSMALTYVARGWAVIPLHWITGDGSCSCGSADPTHVRKQGGKHPLRGRWDGAFAHDDLGRPIGHARTPEQCRELFEPVPAANVGIVTGAASGFWVLDVDPDNGGHTALAGLVAAYGQLPETYTVLTGSGGMHYYWAIPEWEPHAYRGRLPAGLDVRGWHGQVVAPPSVSGKGGYGVGVDCQVGAAPGWLLDLIRPEAPRQAGESQALAAAPEWRPETAGLDRAQAYARTGASQVLDMMANAPEGTRDQTSVYVARRLVELANLGGWDPEHVRASFLAACALASDRGETPFPEAVAAAKWQAALRWVGQRAAEVPESDMYGTAIAFDELGLGAAAFSMPGTAAPLVAPGSASATSPTLPTGLADPAADGLDASTIVAPAAAVDPMEARREQAIQLAMGQLWVRREAERRLRELEHGPFALEILDREQLRKMAPPEPLVQGWLAKGQVTRVYGPPGAGKSFVAVELAACVSTGTPWHGRRVAQGEVVYFAAEDAAGVALRLDAWERHHETEHRVHLVNTGLNLDVETAGRVLGAMRGYFGPRGVEQLGLVVIDTQAMVTGEMDENSASEMAGFVKAIKLIASTTGATVLVVHHSGVKGGRARGSTSVLGAVDAEMESAIQGRTVTLMSTKQKNTAKPPAIMMNLHTVDVEQVDAFGQSVTSCVLVAAGDPGTPITFVDPDGPGALSLGERRALAIATVLIETQATGETYARIRQRACAMTDFGKTPAGITSAFSRAWASLVDRGRVAKALGREAYYFVELDGLDRLAPNPDKKVIGAPETYVPDV